MQASKVYYSAPNKPQGLLHTLKDKLDPSNRAGVYRIPCECCHVYIRETGRNRPTRLKEHRAQSIDAEEISRSQPLWSTSTSMTTNLTGRPRRPLSPSYPSTHGIPDASERPSRSSSITPYPKTSASTSTIFGSQHQSQRPTQTEGSWPSGLVYWTQVLVLSECGFESRPGRSRCLCPWARHLATIQVQVSGLFISTVLNHRKLVTESYM